MKNFRARKTKTPVVIQMDMAECGAAALASILAYYGAYISLEEMREKCEVSRFGCRADKLLLAAREYGLKAQAAKADLEDLKTLKFPVIAHWQFNHFIIVEEVRGNYVYINDPAAGHKRIDLARFNKDFTGIILLLEPSESFVKRGRPFSLRRGLMSYIKKQKIDFLFLILASFALSFPVLALVTISKIFIDNILIQDMHFWIRPLLFAVFLFGVFRALITSLQRSSILKIHVYLTARTTVAFMKKLLSLPLSFYQQRFAGDIIERMNANDRIIQVISDELISQLIGIFMMFIYALVLFILSWQLTLASLFFTGLNLIIFSYMVPLLEENGRVILQQKGQLQGLQMSHIKMIETIKSMGHEQLNFNRYANLHAKTINNQLTGLKYQQILTISSFLTNGLMYVIVLCLGCYLIIRGFLSVGSLIAFQTLFIYFQTPLAGLMSFGDQLQRLKGDFHRINDVINHVADPRSYIKNQAIDLSHGEIQLHQLSFSYHRSEAPFLKDINLHIRDKSRVALVGKTGSGKSTLIKLILGLYQAQQGEIVINGANLNTIAPSQLAHLVSYVEQETGLIRGTLRDNLCLFNQDASEESMLSCLREAEILETLKKRSEAYCLDLLIEENGVNFSAGQRQRIEIARGLMNPAKILILDEITANLDLALEKKIIANLFKREQTIVLITHRLSVVEDCDQIIVMDRGNIIASGTHKGLMQDCKFYQQLFLLDEGSYDE